VVRYEQKRTNKETQYKMKQKLKNDPFVFLFLGHFHGFGGSKPVIFSQRVDFYNDNYNGKINPLLFIIRLL